METYLFLGAGKVKEVDKSVVITRYDSIAGMWYIGAVDVALARGLRPNSDHVVTQDARQNGRDSIPYNSDKNSVSNK